MKTRVTNDATRMKDMQTNDQQQIVRAVGWTGLAKIIGQISTFGTTLLLARLLDKDDLGLFAMAVLYAWVIDNITDGGFQSAIIQRKEIDDDSLSSCFWLLTGISVAVVAVSQLVAPWIADIFADNRLTSIVRQISWIFLIIPPTIVSSGILSRRLRLDTIAKAELGAGLTRCAFSAALALAGMGVLSLVYGYLAERVLVGVLLTHAARWKPKSRFVYQSVRPLISFGLDITAGRLLWLGYSKMDTFIVARFLGAEILGIYSVASQIALAFAQFISAAYYRVVFPLLSKSQDSPRFKEILLKSSVYLSIVALPVMLGIAVVAPDIVLVFLGDKWQDAIPVLQVLSIVAAMQTLSGLLPQAMNAVGRADMSIWINLSSLVVFGIGFYLGVQWQGLNGVLIVWLILGPLRSIANVSIACLLLGLPVAEYLRRHVGSFTATLIMLPVAMTVAETTGTWPAPSRLVLCVLFGALAYAALSLLLLRRPCLELVAMLKTQPKATA